ncbi:alpha-amylase family glycosyl hydrolase [Klebsiella pneumoniae]|nr:alpha-amylase family glycosyl hydrolase [Klebsiella pneumoniae]
MMAAETGDHLQPDPRFGTIADVIELIARACAGLRVIVELASLHTSAQHLWFQAARRDPGRRGGRIICGPTGPPETTILPCFPALRRASGAGTNRAGQYYRHMFYHHEPDLNLAHPPRSLKSKTLSPSAAGWGCSAFVSMLVTSGRAGRKGRRDARRLLLTQARQVVQRSIPMRYSRVKWTSRRHVIISASIGCRWC